MDEPSFADWTARLKLYNEYIQSLADYKLKTSQAELETAKAANQWATVRAKRFVITQIVRDLKAFNRSRNSRTKEVKRIESRAKAAMLLLRGSRIDSTSFTRAWIGYVWFESRALVSSGDALFRIRVKASARGPHNFVSIRQAGAVAPAPSDVTNALRLMDWMHDHRYIASRGSDAQRVVVELLQKINQVAGDTVSEIEKRLEAIRKGTYHAWNFNAILGVSDDNAAKKIEGAGSV